MTRLPILKLLVVFDMVGGFPKREPWMATSTTRWEDFPHDAGYLVLLDMLGIVHHIVYSRLWNFVPRFIDFGHKSTRFLREGEFYSRHGLWLESHVRAIGPHFRASWA
jgi:hypothetical protein